MHHPPARVDAVEAVVAVVPGAAVDEPDVLGVRAEAVRVASRRARRADIVVCVGVENDPGPARGVVEAVRFVVVGGHVDEVGATADPERLRLLLVANLDASHIESHEIDIGHAPSDVETGDPLIGRHTAEIEHRPVVTRISAVGDAALVDVMHKVINALVRVVSPRDLELVVDPAADVDDVPGRRRFLRPHQGLERRVLRPRIAVVSAGRNEVCR
jgi:hypothetical protein